MHVCARANWHLHGHFVFGLAFPVRFAVACLIFRRVAFQLAARVFCDHNSGQPRGRLLVCFNFIFDWRVTVCVLSGKHGFGGASHDAAGAPSTHASAGGAQ